jgi:hypothetical protein
MEKSIQSSVWVRLSIGKRPFCGNFYDVNVRMGSATMIAITSSQRPGFLVAALVSQPGQ